MKRPSRVLRIVASLGMLISMLAAFGPTGAIAATDPGFEPGVAPSNLLFDIDGAQEVYFPWVYNDDNFGLGDANGTVSIQNLTHADGYVFFYVGNGDGYDYTTYAYLAAGASKSFSADAIGVPSPGAPVVAALYAGTITGSQQGSAIVCEWEYGVDIDGDGDASDCVPVETRENVTYLLPLWAGGVVKSAVAGASLPYTTSADTAVSGYNGLSGAEVGQFDQHYLPLVQTNGGPGGPWDTRVTVANLRGDANAAVTLRFFPNDGDGSGSLQTGWQENVLVNAGDVYQTTLSDLVPEGWTGSLHIYSDTAVGVIADRYKVGTDMWLTNTGSNANFEWGNSLEGIFSGQYILFAPMVYMDYNGWNTGFSVANLVPTDNNVNIQYVHNGNAIQVLTQRIAAHGMVTAYRPSSPSQDQNQQNPMYDQIAGALILSDYPVAAAVDAVKYFGNDNNVGQAMSYNATANLSVAQSMPLVQKGNPSTGMGATSGLTLLNPLPLPNSMTVSWLNQSGFNAANFGTSTLVVPAQSIGVAYTMTQHNLPNGYYGSAVVHANLPFAMTSGNVDYQVDGDGSVIWNGYNPCGQFRAFGSDCVFGWPEEDASGSLTKTVLDENGDPVVGAEVEVTGEDVNGDDFLSIGVTDVDGSITFAVVPGVYAIEITAPPADAVFGDGSDLSDSDVIVAEDAEVTVVNNVVLLEFGSLTKVVEDGDGNPISGVSISVTGEDEIGGTYEQTGTTNADGEVIFEDLIPGTYDIEVTAPPAGAIFGEGSDLSDEDVVVDDGEDITVTNVVDLVPLEATIVKTVVVDIEGVLTPVVGLTVAIFPGDSCPLIDVAADLSLAIGQGVTTADGTVEITVPVEAEGSTVCLTVVDLAGIAVSVDTDMALEAGAVVELQNEISLDVELPGTILKTVTDPLEAVLGGVQVYAFAGILCPAVGDTVDASLAVTSGITNILGQVTLALPAGDGYCLVVTDENGVVVSIDTDLDVSFGSPLALTNVIDVDLGAALGVLDIHLISNLLSPLVDLYIFEGSTCAGTLDPANADHVLLDVDASVSQTIVAGDFCIGVDLLGDGTIDLSASGNLAAGDPAESGLLSSDVVLNLLLGIIDINLDI